MAQSQTFTVDVKRPSQFTGRSVQSGLPVTLPLDTLEDLFYWEPNDSLDKGQSYTVAIIPHCPKVIPSNGVKTLVCHDMKGGYLEDRFVQGFKSDKPVGYHIQYWSGIDIFVYFSHHFITIPPVGWINAGHRNGVTVLGTFITEWTEGAKRCREFLSCEALWKATANRLVDIAKFYGFDGWLLNFECAIEPSKVEALQQFVKYLRDQMHLLDKNAKVIWYDSVTCDGTLAWQNELNDKNRCFYEVSDGIFLNYTWTEKQLENSRKASTTPDSVYVGIDVFGRGCFGGGGFNTSQALAVARRHGLSAAIFAPGWVYEEFGADKFAAENERFWKLLRNLTPNYQLAVGSLSTQFCPGYGQKRDPNGVRGQHWYCLNWQDTMPRLTDDRLKLSISESGNYLAVVKPRSGQKHQQREMADGTVSTPELMTAPLFELKMTSSSDGSVTVNAKAWNDWPLPKLKLLTDVGECEIILGSAGTRKSGDFVVEDLVNDCNIISRCIKHPKVFCIESMKAIVDINEKRVTFLEVLPGRHVPKQPIIAPAPLTCTFIDWSVDQVHQKMLLLSCSLNFIKMSRNTQHSEILFRLGSNSSNLLGGAAVSDFVNFGRAYTDRFRVHELSINNPKFEGPDCFVEFLVRHVGPANMTLSEGRISVKYAENI
uniref:Cytosolic endo-beta-N-acetylglucosaminidase n=1 Tax=Phallusia mammillata TaxID=59560 RepID=A0A6F9DC49_9ASCI|nr:cytosolic endo-beta-N-acetylglucosaminidase-like [Phallusia mammillata]